jgi:hypothetical protein
MSSYIPILLTLWMSVPTVVAPEPTTEVNDVRCALASNAVAQGSQDQKQKQAARDMFHFYLGRIDARLNAAQLRVEMAAQRNMITPANLNLTMQSCLSVARTKLRAIRGMRP